jgi:hypothetical protein
MNIMGWEYNIRQWLFLERRGWPRNCPHVSPAVLNSLYSLFESNVPDIASDRRGVAEMHFQQMGRP